MIHSMTAFARKEVKVENNIYCCELRSINHRYLEINLHLPENLRPFEMTIRDILRSRIKRGKIECHVRNNVEATNESSISINAAFVQAICVACENIASFIPNAAKISPMQILQFPGVLEKSTLNKEVIEPILHTLIEDSLSELITVRAREGAYLGQLFLEKIEAIQNELAKIKNALPRLLHDVSERLNKRFNEAKMTLDANRLEQEMVMFTHKIDIAEEIDRIELHLQEVKRVLAESGSVGRRLDFLMQELNREANTLGSKSSDALLTHAAIEIKVLIEQMREQIQNVE